MIWHWVSGRWLILLTAIALLVPILLWPLFSELAERDYQQQRNARLSDAMAEVDVAARSLREAFAAQQGAAKAFASGIAVVEVLDRFCPAGHCPGPDAHDRAVYFLDDPDFQSLTNRFRTLAVDLGLAGLYLLDAQGNAVVGSLPNMLGTNYADRVYFKQAMQGRPATQAAVGRLRDAYVLIFAAPIMRYDQAIGMVGASLDLASPALPQRPDSLLVMTDDQGVVVHSTDRSLLLSALPDAPVIALEEDARQLRYGRTSFSLFDLQVVGQHEGVWARGSEGPVRQMIWVTAPITDAITIHVLNPLPDREGISTTWLRLYIASTAAGMLTVLLIGSALMFLAAVRSRDLELLALNAQLLALSRTDPLTGCANRRHFLERLDIELQRQRRQSQPLSLLSLDLDHFKHVNDTHGHAAGDAVLRTVVQCLQGRLRSVDLLGRVGGEEFAVLLPATPATAAHDLADILRQRVAETLTELDGKALQITVSIGGVSLDDPHRDVSAAECLARADAALYQAKADGRNRVVWAQAAVERSTADESVSNAT